jgi:hypothetical protein
VERQYADRQFSGDREYEDRVYGWSPDSSNPLLAGSIVSLRPPASTEIMLQLAGTSGGAPPYQYSWKIGVVEGGTKQPIAGETQPLIRLRSLTPSTTYYVIATATDALAASDDSEEQSVQTAYIGDWANTKSTTVGGVNAF